MLGQNRVVANVLDKVHTFRLVVRCLGYCTRIWTIFWEGGGGFKRVDGLWLHRLRVGFESDSKAER